MVIKCQSEFGDNFFDLTKSLTLEQLSILKGEMEQYIVSKNGVTNSHDTSWRNAVIAMDQGT